MIFGETCFGKIFIRENVLGKFMGIAVTLLYFLYRIILVDCLYAKTLFANVHLTICLYFFLKLTVCRFFPPFAVMFIQFSKSYRIM